MGGAEDGRFADNIVHFARLLRRAGMKVGPAAVIDAIEAARVAGVGSREVFHATLGAVFVKRREDQPVFDEAFASYWRSRDVVGKLIALMSPSRQKAATEERRKAGETRVSDALLAGRERRAVEKEEERIEIDARLTASERDVLRHTDFAQMTAAEIAAAKRAMAGLVLPDDRVPTRRFRPALRPGRIDPRATMRDAMRIGGGIILPKFRKRRVVHPPLVVIADISGSMSQYTRIFLHFLHALTERRRRVHTFVFGTRLTNVTRQMRHRDPDEAFAELSALVNDWSGGTRIGETLKLFNRRWSRRVLGQGAVLLLITDGLERDDTQELESEIDRLHRSCRRLIWLNPLLRFEGFSPRARGVRAMLPHVDELRAVHNLQALEDLVSALSGQGGGASDPRRFLERR
ncbi:vWA domain-containing protein [Ensifer soli]|uniref:vWA domain-containing protein n=1 Tax=Ciceribacter sp. sgz301302 TaxID=3342379 RepID=UPI0035B88F9F